VLTDAAYCVDDIVAALFDSELDAPGVTKAIVKTLQLGA
jgi:hypothetical protein